ncbi:hypothetical protein P2G88_02285 [Aliiglaciecola sp. CAU 1673]|uniref:hypothetical protein n=1 Tax=Aliiglaciecola sp. CAU 1673 TaxID=3032595 RepID=UPI0023DCEA31|nr:hypothetical protein [Aliiglaciecola sp. CAU 1673]MDF2177079.1 hypothetical protein [Aliiglaciecola sp. CAU 1673]
MIRRHNKDQAFSQRRGGIKDENIDRQILVLHSAILEKLIAQPQLLSQVMDTLERRREMGKMRHGAYLTWFCALEYLQDKPELTKAALLEDSPRMRKLRRQTPLVGILNEEERQAALLAEACGHTSIDVLTGR